MLFLSAGPNDRNVWQNHAAISRRIARTLLMMVALDVDAMPWLLLLAAERTDYINKTLNVI